MTISIGISAWNLERLDTAESVLTRADEARYRSKAAGRNRVTVENPMLIRQTTSSTYLFDSFSVPDSRLNGFGPVPIRGG